MSRVQERASQDERVAIKRLGSRENAFDLLRLFAASAVVVQHANTEFAANFGWGFFEQFDGVAIFFVMSGMLVYLSAEKIHEKTGGWAQFYKNRFLRIAPAVYAFTLLVPIILLAIGAVTLGSILVPKDLGIWVVGNGLLLTSYDMPAWSHVGVGAMTWPLYTIPAEVSFYVITPLLVIAAKRYGFWRMLVPFFALGVLGAVLYTMSGGATVDSGVLSKLLSHTFLQRGAAFAVGIFWAKHWGRVPVRWWITSAAVVTFVLLVTVGDGLPGAAQKLLTLAPISYLIMVIGYGAPKWLARIPKYIGDLSFGTYLWQYFVINLLLWYGHDRGGWLVAATLVLSWVAASISWRLIEKPALRLKTVSLRRA